VESKRASLAASRKSKGGAPQPPPPPPGPPPRDNSANANQARQDAFLASAEDARRPPDI